MTSQLSNRTTCQFGALKCVVALTIACFISPSLFAADANWDSFQNGGQVSLTNSSQNAETDWSTGFETSWTKAIDGYGQSSPVIWKDSVYVTSVEGDNKDDYHIQAFRLSDGEPLWKFDLKNPAPQKSSTYVSRAAPTSVTDRDGVISFFEGGAVVALNHQGEVRWQLNLIDEYGANPTRHGIGSSLEQDADSVFVWVERTADPYVLRLKKSNGDVLWKSAGLGVTSWSSPRLISVGKTSQLVLSGSGKIAGLDVQTGKQFWELTDIGGNSVPTPIPAGDGRFLIGASEGRGGDAAASGRAAESNGLIQISQNDMGQWSAQFVWKAKRATSSFGSPIVHAGLAYFVNRSGVLYALDAKTGEERFAKRIGESVWATPIATNNAVLFFGKKGAVGIVATGNEFEQLHSSQIWPTADAGGNPFGGPTLYGVAVSGSNYIVRRGDQLICLKK